MAISEIIVSIGKILHTILNLVRTALNSFGDYLYLILLIISLIGSFFIVHKFITNWRDIFSKRYIGWFLLIALLIFIILAFI